MGKKAGSQKLDRKVKRRREKKRGGPWGGGAGAWQWFWDMKTRERGQRGLVGGASIKEKALGGVPKK